MTDPTKLVIHAHPVAESLNRALFRAAIEGLTSSNGDAPTTASLTDGDDPSTDDLRPVDTLVLVYPTWWGGPPSILLDWIDRRLGPWIDDRAEHPSPVAAVETLAVVTTHGSPQLLNRITGEPGRQLFKRTIKPLAAPTCSWHWLAYYGIDADNADTRHRFLDDLPGRLREITSG